MWTPGSWGELPSQQGGPAWGVGPPGLPPQPLLHPGPRFPKYLSAKFLIPGLWHPDSCLRKAQCSGRVSPTTTAGTSSAGAPAQLPSFLLQDPGVQEQEGPPPRSAGAVAALQALLTPDPGPTGSAARASACTEGPGAGGRGAAQDSPSPPVGEWGAPGGGRHDSGLPQAAAGRRGARRVSRPAYECACSRRAWGDVRVCVCE